RIESAIGANASDIACDSHQMHETGLEGMGYFLRGQVTIGVLGQPGPRSHFGSGNRKHITPRERVNQLRAFDKELAFATKPVAPESAITLAVNSVVDCLACDRIGLGL